MLSWKGDEVIITNFYPAACKDGDVSIWICQGKAGKTGEQRSLWGSDLLASALCFATEVYSPLLEKPVVL